MVSAEHNLYVLYIYDGKYNLTINWKSPTKHQLYLILTSVFFYYEENNMI